MHWRAFYSDSQVISDRELTPEELPVDGLVCVMEYLDDGYKNIHHGEFIWHRAGKWGTALTEFDAQVYGDQVFPGVLMPDADWEKLQAEAMRSTWQ